MLPVASSSGDGSGAPASSASAATSVPSLEHAVESGHAPSADKPVTIQPTQPATPPSLLHPDKYAHLSLLYAGRMKFWCGGRVMTGPGYGVLAGTFVAIVAPAAVYIATTCMELIDLAPSGWWVVLVASVLLALTLYFLFQVSTADPGIFLRLPPEMGYKWHAISQEIMQQGKAVQLRYCQTCNIHRPPRCVHCTICSNCVEHFDHHCPWLGTCVGRGNYRPFFLFLTFLNLLVWLLIATCIWHLVLAAQHEQDVRQFSPGGPIDGGRAFWKALNTVACASFVLGIYGFIFMLFTTPLYLFHIYLVFTGMTTNEMLKHSFPHGSPHSRGWYRNFLSLFCRVPPRSRLQRAYKLNARTQLPFSDEERAIAMAALKASSRPEADQVDSRPRSRSFSSASSNGDAPPAPVLDPDRFLFHPLSTTHRFVGFETRAAEETNVLSDKRDTTRNMRVQLVADRREMEKRERRWEEKRKQLGLPVVHTEAELQPSRSLTPGALPNGALARSQSPGLGAAAGAGLSIMPGSSGLSSGVAPFHSPAFVAATGANRYPRAMLGMPAASPISDDAERMDEEEQEQTEPELEQEQQAQAPIGAAAGGSPLHLRGESEHSAHRPLHRQRSASHSSLPHSLSPSRSRSPSVSSRSIASPNDGGEPDPIEQADERDSPPAALHPTISVDAAPEEEEEATRGERTDSDRAQGLLGAEDQVTIRPASVTLHVAASATNSTSSSAALSPSSASAAAVVFHNANASSSPSPSPARHKDEPPLPTSHTSA